MREDMARVIVERPRHKPYNVRKGRVVPVDMLPAREGMRRGHAWRGERKELNENLAPVRRYLEKQVGRPWDKVYAEIARHLRADSTVQQHVRDHIGDFVAIKPRRLNFYGRRDCVWWQPLYVDPATGLLCRTDRLPENKARRRAWQNRPTPPRDRVRLDEHSELRLIDGLWFHVQRAPLPAPEYRVYRDMQTRRQHVYSLRHATYQVEIDVRRLITRDVWDVAEKKLVPVGPAIDDFEHRQRFRREHPERTYAVAKRVLSRRELKRHGLQNPTSSR